MKTNVKEEGEEGKRRKKEMRQTRNGDAKKELEKNRGERETEKEMEG